MPRFSVVALSTLASVAASAIGGGAAAVGSNPIEPSSDAAVDRPGRVYGTGVVDTSAVGSILSPRFLHVAASGGGRIKLGRAPRRPETSGRRRLQEQSTEESSQQQQHMRASSHLRRKVEGVVFPSETIDASVEDYEEGTCSGKDWDFSDLTLAKGRCVSGWEEGDRSWKMYPQDFKDANGDHIMSDHRMYTCPTSGKRIFLSNSMPNHPMQFGNPHRPCERLRKFTLPLNPSLPTSASVIREPGNFGVVSMALNGVPIFGALELDGNNAAEPGGGNVQDAQFWYGHATAINIEHYHDPWAGGGEPGENTLIGYALDGYPLYGPIEDDAMLDELDECNGREVDGQYRYHVRQKETVNETLPYCADDANNSPVLNWKYIVGCFKGPVNETTMETWDPDNFTATDDLPSDCVLEFSSDLTPPAAVATVGNAGSAASDVGAAKSAERAGTNPQRPERPNTPEKAKKEKTGTRRNLESPPDTKIKTNKEGREQVSRRTAQIPGSIPEAKRVRPNILIIQPDDLPFYNEWDPNPIAPNEMTAPDGTNFPAYGMPNIERLRKASVRMRQAHAASPMCGTSRYSTITGRYPSRSAISRRRSVRQLVGDVTIPTTKLEDVIDFARFEKDYYDCTRDNVAAALKENGYRTGMVGKWHLQSLDKSAAYNYMNEVSKVENCGFDFVGAMYSENLVESFTDQGRFSHNMEWVTSEGIKFMDGDYDSFEGEDDKDKPWMMYYNPTVPHFSADIAKILDTVSCRETIDADHPLPRDPLVRGMTYDLTVNITTPDGTVREKEVESGSCQKYRESLKERARAGGLSQFDRHVVMGAIWLDDAIGSLLMALEERNELKNTIIIFQMDHGLTEKTSLYEGGNRIAQFVHYPDAYGTDGLDFHGLVSTIDVAPTVLDFAGVQEAPYPMDGSSWADAVGDEIQEAEWRDSRCLFFESQRDRAVRCGLCDKFLTLRLEPGWLEDPNNRTFTADVGLRSGMDVDRSLYFDLCGGTQEYVLHPQGSQEQSNQLFDADPNKIKLLRNIVDCHKTRTSPQNGTDPDYSTTCGDDYAPWIAAGFNDTTNSSQYVCGDVGLVPVPNATSCNSNNCTVVDLDTKTCNWVLNNNACDEWGEYCEEACGNCTVESGGVTASTFGILEGEDASVLEEGIQALEIDVADLEAEALELERESPGTFSVEAAALEEEVEKAEKKIDSLKQKEANREHMRERKRKDEDKRRLE